MKIVHVITGLNNGGAEGVLYRLVTHDKDNEHIVVSMMDGGKYGPLLKNAGIKVYCLNMESGKALPQAVLKLLRLLRKINPDIVQTWMYHADLIGGLVAKLLRVKKIFWNIRQSNFDSKYTKASTIKVAKINAKLSSFIPNKIICCAEDAVSIHKDIGYDKEKMTVIANGYDLNKFKTDIESCKTIRDELQIGSNPVIGMVGRYDPQKNHKGLIEALKLVKDKGYTFDLILVGKDLNESNQALIKQIKKSNLYDSTYLLDQRSDIADIMNALDIHILSSAYGEGFPNVVAEAMACGTPCIATNVGDSKKIIGSFGVVVLPNQVGELADAVVSLLECMKDDTKWSMLKRDGTNHINKNFSIDEMVLNYKNVWSEKV